jgi:hypothetical protein
MKVHHHYDNHCLPPAARHVFTASSVYWVINATQHAASSGTHEGGNLCGPLGACFIFRTGTADSFRSSRAGDPTLVSQRAFC